MGQHPRGPGEVEGQEGDPARSHGESRPPRSSREPGQLHEQEEDQPVKAEQDDRVAGLVGLPRGQRDPPGASMHELEHAAEAEPEEQRAGDGEQGRSELVRPVVDEDTADERRGGSGETVVARHVVGERGGVAVQVLRHHEQRGDDRDQDVQREKRRLERPVHRLVAPPSGDRHSAQRARILTLGPFVRAPRHGLDAGSRSMTLQLRPG